MRILHTEWSDDLGGQEKRVLSEAAGLRDRGHEITIVCRGHAKIRLEAEGAGLEVKILPLRRPYDVESISRLTTFIRKKRFDVVNTHSGIDSWIGGIAARLAGTPVLVRTRHLNIPLKRSPLNFIHYLPDMYITCGENMRENLVKQCGFPPERVISIPTGVDEEFFNVERNRERKRMYGVDPDTPVVVNIGILRSVKGHEVTLKAASIVAKVIPEARFLLVGEGPRRKALQQMADEMGLKNVIFTGFIDDVRDVLAVADLSVLSSWSEGLPQSLLQAMAAGVPVVATKVGGIPEVVRDGETGFLVEPGDHEGLARKIIMILQDRVDEDMLERAREVIKRAHTRERMIEKTEALYMELLRKKHNEKRL